MAAKTKIRLAEVITFAGLSKSTWNEWHKRKGVETKHNHDTPKMNWYTPVEKMAVVKYVLEHKGIPDEFWKSAPSFTNELAAILSLSNNKVLFARVINIIPEKIKEDVLSNLPHQSNIENKYECFLNARYRLLEELNLIKRKELQKKEDLSVKDLENWEIYEHCEQALASAYAKAFNKAQQNDDYLPLREKLFEIIQKIIDVKKLDKQKKYVIPGDEFLNGYSFYFQNGMYQRDNLEWESLIKKNIYYSKYWEVDRSYLDYEGIINNVRYYSCHTRFPRSITEFLGVESYLSLARKRVHRLNFKNKWKVIEILRTKRGKIIDSATYLRCKNLNIFGKINI